HSLEQNPKEDMLGHAIRDHIDILDRDHALFKQQVTKTFRELESRVNKMADELTNRQFDDLQELRNEIREGFKTLHDSIQNSKTVLDGKHKLLEENLRQELSQIRKMVVLM
ncbi:FAM81A, partial [Cichlidogyrus casuarinus]